jgi:abequosyltransferase
MPDLVATQPLLTIALPTYNRALDLLRLLTALAPQLAGHPEVEVFIYDNASTDSTAEMVAQFLTPDTPIRYYRQQENLGLDKNFVTCHQLARGKYFWICGDDDVLLPGGLDLILSHLSNAADELDILYLSSYPFTSDYLAERTCDRLNRLHHTFTSAAKLTYALHINFTFISGIITNRQRFLQLPHEDPATFLGTSLVQLSWTLPLLRQHRRSRILWTRIVASKAGNSGSNSGGYSLSKIFGKNLFEMSTRLLPDRPDLSACIVNLAISRWFPGIILEFRTANNKTMRLDETRKVLEPIYRRNFRYWLFTYPALQFPLPLARIWVKITNHLLQVLDRARTPFFWRKLT